jgi:predicted ferric reductase
MAGPANTVGQLGDTVRRLYVETGVRARLTALAWILLYLAVVLLPLAVIAIAPPPGRDFWTELSVTLGFIGLAMLGLQFALTARFRRVQAPYGMDVVIQFHRQISLVAFAFILTHPVILAVSQPARLQMLNPLEGELSVRLGWSAVTLLALLIVTALWRVRFGLTYEWWRLSHGLLAVGGLALALWHVVEVGYYLGDPWKQALWAAMALVVVGLLGYVRVVKPWMLIRRPWVVEEVRREHGDAWTLVLRADGHEGLDFRPGQFAWLTVRSSPFALEEHPFSFSSSALQPDRVELGIKELGDFTSRIGSIEPGSRAFLDGPYGAFSLDRYHGAGYVFIAGGIGITPVMSMLRTLEERGDTRPVLLLYANPDWDGVTFRDEVDRFAGRPHIRVVHVLNDPPEGWQGETGFVDAGVLDRYLPEHPETHQYFVCGPPPMMDAVERALREQGVPLERIQEERFSLN